MGVYMCIDGGDSSVVITKGSRSHERVVQRVLRLPAELPVTSIFHHLQLLPSRRTPPPNRGAAHIDHSLSAAKPILSS